MFFTVFNMRLAGYLMQRGFVLMDIAENRNGSGRKVFYFKESNALQGAIQEWKKINNKH